MKFAALASLGLCTLLLADPGDSKEPEKPFAEREERKISVKPEGPTFTVPAAWLDWHAKFKNALHVTRAEIDATKSGGGEWDTEYAELVNACLDFDACAFAGGGEGWGNDSCSFADLQMRLYVLDGKPEAIEKKIEDAGPKALRVMMSPARVAERDGEDPPPPAKEDPKDEKAALEKFKPLHGDMKGWKTSLFSYELHYGDYGDEANVDIRLKQFGTKTVVVVFMYTDFSSHDAAMNAITKSITWPDAPQPKKEEPGEKK